MSTFSNSPLAQSTAENRAFATILTDDMLVPDLRTGDASNTLPRLNANFNMQLSEATYQRIQDFFCNTARRDPTVGELRLLDGLDRHNKDSPERIAIGELVTDSPVIAETWADMMQKHGVLHGVGHTFRGKNAVVAPPCSLTDALSLTGRYLQSIKPSRTTDRVLLSTPAQEAVASAEGYTPLARILVGKETVSLWARKNPSFHTAPPRKGDFILYLPCVKLTAIRALLADEAPKARPILHEVRAVATKSLLLTLAEFSTGLDVYANRFTNEEASSSDLPVDILCSSPTVQPDGTCDFLLRVSIKQLQSTMEALKRLDIHATVCGQVNESESMVIHIRDAQNTRNIPVAKLPGSFLLSMHTVYLHRFQVQRSTSTPPHPPILPTARFPSSLSDESGLTPASREAVALTIHEGQILPLTDILHLTSSASSILRRRDLAYAQAAETVVTVTDRLFLADVAPDDMILSVALIVPSSEGLKDGAVLAAIMGIYRVASERGLPVEDPTITVAPTEGLLRVTVTAHAEDKNEFSQRLDCPPNRQWRTSDVLPHKESPGFLFPILHHAHKGCLRALSAALNRDHPARCVIHPVHMDEREVEVHSGSPTAGKEIVRTLNPDSVRELCEQLHNWFTPVFCMSEEDTRSLLSIPDIVDSLNRLIDKGYPVIVLGDSCKVFAEYGFLPDDLMHLQSHPITRRKATATYTIPAEPSTRLFRGRLLSAPISPTLPHLLTLRFSDGTATPDGFIGRNGKVLGILNGVDTTVLPILRKHTFDF